MATSENISKVISETGGFWYECTCCINEYMYLFQNRVTEQIPLDPLINKTGGVWHIFLKGDFKDMLYGYKIDGKFSPKEGHYYDSSRVLLDPYAKVSGSALL